MTEIFGQVFEFRDIFTVSTLAFLEILLSADNAIVLGMIVKRLPEKSQKTALFIGLYSAIFLRAIAIVGIAFLLKYKWIQLLGAAYLLYLSVTHLAYNKPVTPLASYCSKSFWKTVFWIECLDLVFAIDSIVAAIAFLEPSPAGMTQHPKLWIVYVGGMLGVCTMRYAATLFIKVNQRFPHLETSAYLMVGWIGVKLSVQALGLTFPFFSFLFWGVLISLFAIGFRK